jgi:hypothetical protein
MKLNDCSVFVIVSKKRIYLQKDVETLNTIT